jgi:hypothetical protein
MGTGESAWLAFFYRTLHKFTVVFPFVNPAFVSSKLGNRPFIYLIEKFVIGHAGGFIPRSAGAGM